MFNVMFSKQLPAWQTSLVLVGLTWGLSGITAPAKAIPSNSVHPLSSQLAQAQPVPPQQLQANAEAFVDALFAQKYDQAWQYLAPQTQAENPPAILQRKGEIFVKRTGDFRQRVSSRVDGAIVVIKVEFSKLTDDLIVIMEPDGKVLGVDFPAAPNDASAQPASK
ncbi:hypothetical protein RIF25_13480 [Thermosynechococcaceae cyanobacterium BACA0444]|uniref:DUF3887 domain-containing protein n=1 Tax=Pseudocalidococcus azoricus BACA0444 TaxID=2918990 RepID=A0AAE4FT90_9CYAN|nr:hypothetical protein [Pseudocalidococcus azoricus]MDS3861815.1 hypothetical protein [Pseudocalidococcus azoricus BACA0444]